MATLFKHRIQFEYFHFLIRKHGRYLLMITLLMVAMNPIMILTFNATTQLNAYTLLSGQVFVALIALVTAFLVPVMLFSFLYNQRSMDVFKALPIKQKDLYITLFWTGIFMIIFPYFIGWLSGFVLNIYAGLHIGRTLGYFFISLLPLMGVYSLVLTAIMNTGTILNAVIYSVIIQGLPLLVYLTVFFFWDTAFLGFDYQLNLLIISMLSPIANLFYNFTQLNIPVLLPFYWLLWIILLFFLNKRLFVKRKVEATGAGFINPVFFPLISALAAISVQLLAYSLILISYPADSLFSLRTLLFPLIISLLAYVLLDMISRMNFRNVISAAFRYLLVGILVFAVLLPLRYTNGLGFINKIPEKAESIELTIYDQKNILYQDRNSITLLVTEEAEKERVREFHQLILDNMDAYQYSEYMLEKEMHRDISQIPSTYEYFDIEEIQWLTVELRYHHGTSETVRVYKIPFQWSKALLQLQDTTAYFNAYYSFLDDSVMSLVYLQDPYLSEAVDITRRISTSELKELLHKDFNNETFVDWMAASYQIRGYLQYQYCDFRSETINRLEDCRQQLIPITSNNANLLNDFYQKGIVIPDSQPKEKAIFIYPDKENSRNAIFHFLSNNSSSSALNYLDNYLSKHDDFSLSYTYLTDEQQLLLEDHLLPYAVTEKALPLVIIGNSDIYDSDNQVLMVRADSLDYVLNILSGNNVYYADSVAELYSGENRSQP